MTYTWLSCASV